MFSSKVEEIRSCKETGRISNAVYKLLKKESNHGRKECVHGALWAATRVRGDIGWMQSANVDKMVVGKWTREWGE